MGLIFVGTIPNDSGNPEALLRNINSRIYISANTLQERKAHYNEVVSFL